MIAIGSDHGGFELKEHIKGYLDAQGLEYRDFGCHKNERCDYPEYGAAVAKAVTSGEYEKGILFCGTGAGISIAANKIKGARCVNCSDVYTAALSRQHNNANMLALGGRVVGPGLAELIVAAWLDTAFESGGRHETRVDMITAIEKNEG